MPISQFDGRVFVKDAEGKERRDWFARESRPHPATAAQGFPKYQEQNFAVTCDHDCSISLRGIVYVQFILVKLYFHI